MTSLRNFIFKILMQNKVGYLFSNIEKLIPIIEEYNLIDSTDIFGDGNTLFLQKKRKIFKSTIDDKVSYNIFFDNIQIRMEISPKGTVYSIHLKKVGEPWQFNRDKKGTFDFSHPLTSTYRVYVGYFVPVLNITTVAGEQYTPGNWNEYLYNTIEEAFNDIRDCTDESQFNKCYGCESKKKNSSGDSKKILQKIVKKV